MNTKGRRFLAVGILGSILASAGPALAQHNSGGGHASGGGGGGHAGGGGYAPARGNFGGGGPHYGAGHGTAAGIYGHSGPPAVYRGAAGRAYAGHSPPNWHSSGNYGRGYYGHGYSTGAYWQGGYWRGSFWPRCYYGVGFSWFLPVLPLAFTTYWWGGVPYYYANDVYYTYNPSYEGYVATDPPPLADSGAAAEGAGPSAGPMQGDNAGASGQIYMYPKNGQGAEQQATDKAECQQWAAEQAGQVAQSAGDYQRAMTACVEGRGYSAR